VKLLQIDSSPFGATAVSRRLTKAFVEGWLTEHREGEIARRDLTTIDIPAIDATWVAANYTPEDRRTCQQKEILRLSAELIKELTDADEYVIGMPIHNFGPPSRFKLWVDHIITPSTIAKKLLARKRATFIIAAGRFYAPGLPDSNKNYLVPWLRTVFECLGMNDTQFVFADGSKKLHNGELDLATFLAPHLQAIHALFANKAMV